MSTWSHLILRFVFSQLNATFWAGMSGFLHVIHAEGDKAARPTSNEAKNQCSYHATWTSFTVSHGRNGCSTLVAIYIHRFWAKMSRHDFEIVTQLLKKWFSQIWNEITISTYLSKSVGTLSYWHCSLVCNVFEMVTGPIRVNQEFSFFWVCSISGLLNKIFFSGLNLNIYSGFKPDIHFSCLNLS